jgi:hypothetical protein
MLPIFNTNTNFMHGPKSSTEFINMCDDIHYDITRLYSVANDHTEQIKYNMNLAMVENYFLQNKIYELESALENTQRNISAFNAQLHTRTKTNTFRTQGDLLSLVGHTSAQVDNLHGLVTLPYEVVSKASLIDHTGNVYTPPTLKIETYESSTGGENDWITINDPNSIKAFDCDNSSCWMHTSIYDVNDPINELYILLKITLPLQLVNNAYVNALSIKPFPEYSMDILDVRYRTPSSLVHQTVPNFPPTPIIQAPKTLLMFEPTEMTTVYILLKQPYYFVENNRKYFYYGVQEIKIDYYDYKTNEAYIITRYELNNKYFRIINTPTIKTPVGCPANISDLVSHELFFPSGLDGQLQPNDIVPGQSFINFGDEIVDNYSVAYILTKLVKTDSVVPALSEINVSYLAK